MQVKMVIFFERSSVYFFLISGKTWESQRVFISSPLYHREICRQQIHTSRGLTDFRLQVKIFFLFLLQKDLLLFNCSARHHKLKESIQKNLKSSKYEVLRNYLMNTFLDGACPYHFSLAENLMGLRWPSWGVFLQPGQVCLKTILGGCPTPNPQIFGMS